MTLVRKDLKRTGFCNCGCGAPVKLARKTDARIGHVKGEPVWFIPGHTRRFDDANLPANMVDTGYETPCRIWWASVNSRGYPTRGSKLVHRIEYEQAHGPIPAGHTIHHKCRVPRCIRVDHLVALPPREHNHEQFLIRSREEAK